MKFQKELSFFAPVFVLTITACSPMRFSQYTGKDAIWSTSAGAMADTSYAIPVYRQGTPERPYYQIGDVRFEDPRKYWDDGVIRMAASMAKRRGGDAVIFKTGSAVPGSWLDSWISRPTGYGEEQTALVIKWVPEAEVQARKFEEEKFWANFRTKHPDLATNDQLLRTAVGYLGETGVKANSGGPQCLNHSARFLS